MGILNKFIDSMKIRDKEFDDSEDFLDDDFDLMDDEDDDLFDNDLDEKPNKFKAKFAKKPIDDEDFSALDDDEPIKTFGSKTTSSFKASEKTAATAATAAPKTEKTSSKIMPMRSNKRTGAAGMNMSVCVIKPTSMEDAKAIAETLVKNCTVILNLEGIDLELAQRIVDFTAGSCYSLGGTLQKVSSYIFVLGPYNVDVTGDFQGILDSSVPSMSAGY